LAPWKNRRKIGIITCNTAQWSWIAEGLAFGVSWIYHSNPCRLPRWLQTALPDTFFTSKALALTPVDLVLCEGSYPTWLREWTLAPLVVGCRNCNRFGHVWRQSQTLEYSHLGGLTTTTVKLHILLNVHWKFERNKPASFMDTSVYTVASDTASAGRLAKKPVLRLFHPPVVSPLGRNTYHGGGLYPWSTPRGSIPSLFFRRLCIQAAGVVTLSRKRRLG
jgi:hypothetical protein